MRGRTHGSGVNLRVRSLLGEPGALAGRYLRILRPAVGNK